MAEAIRQIGPPEVTRCCWRQAYGGLKTNQVRRIEDLEQQSGRMRRAVSDLTLDTLILQEAAKGIAHAFTSPARQRFDNEDRTEPDRNSV